MSQIIDRAKKKILHRRPHEAVIPPSLTQEEANLSWGMQVQGIFKKAGMDKYLHETPVLGGIIRMAVPDDGGLCDHPDCPNEYVYALKLNNFSGMVREYSYDGVLGPSKKIGESSIAASAKNDSVSNLTVLVCKEHVDFRPTELLPHRFSKDYTWKHESLEKNRRSNIATIKEATG